MRLVCVYYPHEGFGHVSVPDNLELKAAFERYGTWAREEYMPALIANGGFGSPQNPHLSFIEFLIAREGCVEGVIEEFNEEDGE